jgi:cystathionine beta-lyase
VSSARVALGEGTNYGPAGAGHVRLNLATSPAIITEAVERISAAIAR